jgi:hypothetical protein
MTLAGDRMLDSLDLRDDPSLLRAIAMVLAIEAEAAALALSELEEAADDVRYAGGNGTSDYWRGFNDGIDKLAAVIQLIRDKQSEEKR